MRPIHVAEDIVPVGEFKAHASRLIRRLKETHRAVVITQNGRPAAVLIPAEDYDRFMAHQHFVTSVRQGLADSDAGRVLDDETFKKELEAEFGPLEE